MIILALIILWPLTMWLLTATRENYYRQIREDLAAARRESRNKPRSGLLQKILDILFPKGD